MTKIGLFKRSHINKKQRQSSNSLYNSGNQLSREEKYGKYYGKIRYQNFHP